MADLAPVVYSQPPLKSTPKMDLHLYQALSQDEKRQHECSVQSEYPEPPSSCNHRRCHNARLRQFLIPFLIVLLTLGGLLAIAICCSGSGAGQGVWSSLVAGGVQTLAKRQTGGAPSDSSDNGVFVDRQLYLIVIFVGLLVVVILGIMLSFWCCRSSFENPLCCPCYLCACCGGLACLECIGCGLCAAGASEL